VKTTACGPTGGSTPPLTHHQQEAAAARRRAHLRATVGERERGEQAWPILSTVATPAPPAENRSDARAPAPNQDHAGGHEGEAGLAVPRAAECAFCGALTSEGGTSTP